MSENVEIDRETAIRGLNLALETRGADYVYPRKGLHSNSCVYMHDGQPDCLVAEALFQVGVPMETLNWMQAYLGEIDEIDLDDDAESVVLKIATAPGVSITPEAVEALARAQRLQDVGESWGDAVAAAL